jgi:hypothetical protein
MENRRDNNETTTYDKTWQGVPADCLENLSSGGLTGVYLKPGERVEWHYAFFSDGKRMAIGYTIYPYGKR